MVNPAPPARPAQAHSPVSRNALERNQKKARPQILAPRAAPRRQDRARKTSASPPPPSSATASRERAHTRRKPSPWSWTERRRGPACGVRDRRGHSLSLRSLSGGLVQSHGRPDAYRPRYLRIIAPPPSSPLTVDHAPAIYTHARTQQRLQHLVCLSARDGAHDHVRSNASSAVRMAATHSVRWSSPSASRSSRL